jgi:hypothetical protein
MRLAPSFLSLVTTGILLLVILVLTIKNHKKIMALDYYKLITLVSLISVAIGVHGLIHLVYGFNPL